MSCWYKELYPAVVSRLQQLEAKDPSDPSFWLEHQKYLDKSSVTRTQVLDFVMEGRHSPISKGYGCEQCDASIVVLDAERDEWLCQDCGSVQERERRYFKPFTPESSVYKHTVRLHQILHELQCNRMKLPANIVGDVKEHLKENFTYARIQKSLRKLGYKQHYTMIPTLQMALDPSFEPLQLTRDEEMELTGLFTQYIALGQFSGYRNRLNYHYVISKLADMLGYYWIHPHLRLPKGKKSVQRHDELWSKVCHHLGWEVSMASPIPQIPNLQHKGRLLPLSCSPIPLLPRPSLHSRVVPARSRRLRRNPSGQAEGRHLQHGHPYGPTVSR